MNENRIQSNYRSLRAVCAALQEKQKETGECWVCRFCGQDITSQIDVKSAHKLIYGEEASLILSANNYSVLSKEDQISAHEKITEKAMNILSPKQLEFFKNKVCPNELLIETHNSANNGIMFREELFHWNTLIDAIDSINKSHSPVKAVAIIGENEKHIQDKLCFRRNLAKDLDRLTHFRYEFGCYYDSINRNPMIYDGKTYSFSCYSFKHLDTILTHLKKMESDFQQKFYFKFNGIDIRSDMSRNDAYMAVVGCTYNEYLQLENKDDINLVSQSPTGIKTPLYKSDFPSNNPAAPEDKSFSSDWQTYYKFEDEFKVEDYIDWVNELDLGDR